MGVSQAKRPKGGDSAHVRQPGESRGISRRFFLRGTTLGAVATALGYPQVRLAQPAGNEPSHFVPADKRLDPDWVRALFARGKKEVFRGAELSFIGMPVGGIGTGQLYLCGDGTLGNWEIFNRHEYLGTGELNYAPRVPAKPVDQGFAVAVESAGQSQTRCLNRSDFPGVEFCGQYPVGTVRYADARFPVEVEMEAFSPFIPLNAKDAALPATVFSIKVQNTSAKSVEVRALGWLENVVSLRSSLDVSGAWRTRWVKRSGRTLLCHSAEEAAAAAEPVSERPPISLQDFESADYGAWRSTGEAFGQAPATGRLEAWQEVRGFEGKGLANSFLKQDSGTGTLISPPFKIERRYLNFLIGGGHFPASPAGVELVRLKIGDTIVRSSTGENDEQLRWETWEVAEFEGQQATLEIVDSRPYPGGHILVDSIELSDRKRRRPEGPMANWTDFGTMALAMDGRSDGRAAAKLASQLAAPVNREFQTTSEPYPFPRRRNALLASRSITVAAGGSHVFNFVLAWHFPNAAHGHEYAKRFPNAEAVANYVLDHNARLMGETRRWRDTYYDSTLPFWLLDRLHSTLSTLASGTCQWWANGRFWAWEGVVSCPGTCTHVWNYAHGEAFLFPELARSVREMQDFNSHGGGFHPDSGLVGFRGDDRYAADGQCGTILKSYREHRLSPDAGFLRRNWPAIRKALDFCLRQDADGATTEDGLIENLQPNTYDIAFAGANTFVGSLYLAALRAGEEMARELGEEAYAARLRKIFESGRQLTLERLWNGEYFIQDVDLEKFPDNQYGQGCLSDQLFGQSWAHQLGLGYLYPRAAVRQALESVWRYNWSPEVGPQLKAHPALRTFASPGEAGLFLLTWPRSPYLNRSINYRNEVWTGVEYQVAANLICEGLAQEGLGICRGIHERYHPAKRNPYNEVECGDHYARALASWGVFTALCGFEYHGPNGHIGFAPRITPENFKVAFTAAEGWGSFSQKREVNAQIERIEVRWGRLSLKSLAFALLDEAAPSAVKVTIGRTRLVEAHGLMEKMLTIALDQRVTLNAGETLEVVIVH
jgi:uncharacterized protein (DUF608 family)